MSESDDGPWGQVDGSRGDFREHSQDFVSLGISTGVGRSLADSSVRVVAGSLGSGKSLFLRRMQDEQARNQGVYAADYNNNSAHIDTRDLAVFATDMQIDDGNTEAWKRLWRRAIVSSAFTYLFSPNTSLPQLPSGDRKRQSIEYLDLIGHASFPRKVQEQFGQIARQEGSLRSRDKYLRDPRWGDIEALVSASLTETAPLYLYIDAVDDNYKWSPSLWTQCQRGLYYAVMDLLRDTDALGGRLHIVMAIRDITIASISASEHATRYRDDRYTNILRWDPELIEEFIQAKLERLPSQYFRDPRRRNLESFTGHGLVRPDRRGAHTETILEYFVRHTRIVPRDIVFLGNQLCRFISRMGHDALTDVELKRQISFASREFCTGQLSQVSNQLWSDLLPREALRNEYDCAYLTPNDHQINHNRNMLISAIESTAVEEFDIDTMDRMEAAFQLLRWED